MSRLIKSRRVPVGWLALCACLAPPCVGSEADQFFVIQAVDAENGWPVPLVQLTTTHHEVLVTDNAGVAVVDQPELFDREVWFAIEGHGYRVPADGFGYRGVRLTPRRGESATIELQRQLPAKRVGRLTGAGLFAESQKVGRYADWTEQGVFGCDSIQHAVHTGRLYWLWGDTTLAGYPLGRFHSTGATTPVTPLKELRPPLRLRFGYFLGQDKLPRNIAQMPGEGPTWLSGMVSLPDAAGEDRLVATYSKIRPPLADYERGLCVWDKAANQFKLHKVLWAASEDQPRPTPAPMGHPVLWRHADGRQWAYYGDPFPALRHPATFEDWQNPDAWEVLEPQETVAARSGAQEVTPHRGAIAWNAFRHKWVTVFTQQGGESSYLGELWYAEADAPTGPWRDAVKVVTHNKYTFYNPALHPEMTPNGSPMLLFEATFTHTFSGAHTPVARHDYNQVLYRIDLDEPPFSEIAEDAR
ncbi:MAG: hypothetical protein KDA37_14955 [Planctomycetales bacterium]|nr:hypothetical protein [Planctomycetales bacterium]